MSRDFFIKVVVPESERQKRRLRRIPFAFSHYFLEGGAMIYFPDYDGYAKPEWLTAWPSWGRLNGP